MFLVVVGGRSEEDSSRVKEELKLDVDVDVKIGGGGLVCLIVCKNTPPHFYQIRSFAVLLRKPS